MGRGKSTTHEAKKEGHGDSSLVLYPHFEEDHVEGVRQRRGEGECVAEERGSGQRRVGGATVGGEGWQVVICLGDDNDTDDTVSESESVC